MTILYINNSVTYHYEIILSVIEKYDLLLGISKDTVDSIYLTFSSNDSFQQYIQDKYPHIHLLTPRFCDFFIECTVYSYFGNIVDDNRYQYICHDVHPCFQNKSNVWNLTPLSNKLSRVFYADVFPFQDCKVKTDIPIYVIQGNIVPYRRCYELLNRILSVEYDYPFKIKILGRTHNDEYVFQNASDKLIYRTDLNFVDFHREFTDCYCILPLITKKTHPKYYDNKFTSSISYARGYQLKCLIDRDLQEIYKLDDVEIFQDEGNVINAFRRTLESFFIK
jgi:hypothetical protein